MLRDLPLLSTLSGWKFPKTKTMTKTIAKTKETDPCWRSSATADLFPHQVKSCSKVLPQKDSLLTWVHIMMVEIF